MEAWLKFQAPGISLAAGLSIGRLVFSALNKVEWIMALGIAGSLMLRQGSSRINNFPFLIPFLILLLQTFWLLPLMDARTQLHIDGATLPVSRMHFWYVALEVLKVTSLFFFGSRQFKRD